MKEEHGFTLVELLVTVSVLGLLVVLSAGLFHMGSGAARRVEEASENIGTIEAVQSLLRQELTSLVPAVREGVHPLDLAFEGGATSMAFEAPLPLALGHLPGSIRVAADETGGLMNLTFAWQARGTPKWKKSILLSGIQAAHYSYYGSTREGERPRWLEAWAHQKTLPSLIRLEVVFPDKDRRRWPGFLVAPLVSVDAGCVYDPASKHCFGR